jgi:citrate synthase
MADETLFKPGLEGVVAFESEIAEPDKEGSALRYRGVDIEELVGNVSFGNVWGLLVDGKFNPGLPPPSRSRCRCTPATSASTCSPRSRCSRRRGACSRCSTSTRADPRGPRARLGHDDGVRRAVARGLGKPMVPQSEVDKAKTIVERFMIRWKGDPDPAHTKAVDAYFVSPPSTA